MPQPIPYLTFDGTCAEAMQVYAHILHGTLNLLTTRHSPFAAKCPPEHLDRVMHANLAFEDGTSLYGADSQPGMPYQGMHGVSITLNYGSIDEAQRVFDALAEGGTVMMPFSDTFWAKKFGMLKDRFGCQWIVNGVLIDVQPKT